MWFSLKWGRVWSECFVFALTTAVQAARLLLSMASCCSTIPIFPSIIPSSSQSSGQLQQPDGDQMGAGWWREGVSFWGHLNTRDMQCSESKSTKRTHTHTHTHSAIGGLIPDDSQLVSLRRGEEVRLFTLERIPRHLWSKHTHTYSEIDRIYPLSPHLSLNKLGSVSQAMCCVWL